MQAGGAAQGVGTICGRRGLKAILVASVAVLVVAAILALAVWVVPLATSGVGTEEAVLKAGAGSALIHDDAGNVNPR
jgi:hypothetical protein